MPLKSIAPDKDTPQRHIRSKNRLYILLIIIPLFSIAGYLGCHNDLTSEPSVPLSSLNAILQERQQYADNLRKLQVSYSTYAATVNATIATLQSQNESLAAQLQTAKSQAEDYQANNSVLRNQVTALSTQLSDQGDLQAKFNRSVAELADLQFLYDHYYEYKPLADWSSVSELEAFLASDDTENHVDISGNVTLSMVDCEDYAMTLRGRAAKAGKNIEVIFCTRNQFYQWFNRSLMGPGGNWHALNMAIVGNEYHVIDQLSDEHRHVLDLD